MLPGSPICATCVFWSPQEKLHASENGDRLGQCRRDSPVALVLNGGRLATRWPLVRGADWCGEHATESP